MLENNYVILLIVVAVGAVAYFYFNKSKAEPAKEKTKDMNATGLQLQAYERLTLLTDRIAIPNLVSRTSCEGLSARDMQLLLARTIRDEFEYNITQQIYVTADCWKAVKNLKEKNLLIIHQVAAALPTVATALDLNKALLEYLMRDEKADLHELVGQALSIEAKRLL